MGIGAKQRARSEAVAQRDNHYTTADHYSDGSYVKRFVTNRC